jgi:hypothetical protein
LTHLFFWHLPFGPFLRFVLLVDMAALSTQPAAPLQRIASPKLAIDLDLAMAI